MAESLEPLDTDLIPELMSDDFSALTIGDDIKTSINAIPEAEFYQNTEWRDQKKHIFILSSAGKPIYSRYGSEDRLATLFGVMQALVSVVQDNQDTIQSIHAGNCTILFLLKGPIILVSVSHIPENVEQISLQLTYVYNQVVSVLTLTQLTRIFEQRRNFDLRRLLAGSERLIDHLLTFTETQPAFLLNAVDCLPLSAPARDMVVQTITIACAKIKNLVFVILLAENQLISLVRMKKYNLEPSDLHLIFNMVDSSESFKTAESWTPICLPNFDSSGFLHGHVSYLAEDCQACLLLLTVDRDLFFSLSEAKQKIVEKLRRNGCLEAINNALLRPKLLTSDLSVANVRHFMYKERATSQFLSPAFEAPYDKEQEAGGLLHLYQTLYHTLHRSGEPLKLVYQQLYTETMVAWTTAGFELFVTFEPMVSKINCINAINKLVRWIKQEEERIFIQNSPTF